MKIRKGSLTKKNQSRKSTAELGFSSAKDTNLIEIRQRQIAASAGRLFIKRGYHPTTLRDISKASGMSMGQIYHYVSSKDDILYLIHKYNQEAWIEELRDLGMEKIEDQAERLRKVFHHAADLVLKNDKLFQFLFTETKYLKKKYLRVVLCEINNTVVGFWRKILREMEQKLDESDEIMASNFLTYNMLFFALWGWNLKALRREDSFTFLIDCVLRGLGVMSKGRDAPFNKLT